MIYLSLNNAEGQHLSLCMASDNLRKQGRDGEMNPLKRYILVSTGDVNLFFSLALERTFTNIQPKVLYASRFPRDISLNLGASLRN